MHTFHIIREEVGACWELTLDGKFIVASPNEKLIGGTLIEQLDRLGETAMVQVTDNGPAARAVRNAEQAIAESVARETEWRRPAFAQDAQPETD
jgi:hypothetical protein